MFSFESLIFILLLILMIISIRKSNDDLILNRDNSLSIRGIFAACIMIFHISKETDIFFPVFDYLAIVLVGAFFFLSGFGSAKQYLNRDNYWKDYLKNRFFRLILPYLIMTVVYWIYNNLTENPYTLSEVIKSIINYGPIVMYSWFIVSIIYHYLIYYVVMLICKDNKKLLLYIYIVLFSIGLIAAFINYASPHLVNVLFSLGIIYAYYEDSVNRFVKKYRIILFVASFCFTLLLYIPNIDINRGSELFKLSIKLLFVLIMLSGLCFIRFKNKFIDYLGKISLEIYMLQGLSKMIIRRYIGYSLFIQDFLIFVLCFVLSSVFHYLFSKIDSK